MSSRNGWLLSRVVLFQPNRRVGGRRGQRLGSPPALLYSAISLEDPTGLFLKLPGSPLLHPDPGSLTLTLGVGAALSHDGLPGLVLSFVLTFSRGPAALVWPLDSSQGRPLTRQWVAEQWGGTHAGHWSPRWPSRQENAEGQALFQDMSRAGLGSLGG